MSQDDRAYSSPSVVKKGRIWGSYYDESQNLKVGEGLGFRIILGDYNRGVEGGC